MTARRPIKTVADLLDALERGKIGYAAAKEWLGVESFMDLVHIAHINGRILPGHKPGRVSKETVTLLREACTRL